MITKRGDNKTDCIITHILLLLKLAIAAKMLSYLERWRTEVVLPRSRELVRSLKERRLELERDVVDERSDRRVEDLTAHEREEVARCVAYILHQENVSLQNDKVEAVLKKLSDKYHTEYEGAERKNEMITMGVEGVAMKEGVHWLSLFWDTFRGDMEEYAYDIFQRDHRFLGTSLDKWLSQLTFHAALHHRLFTEVVKPALPKGDRHIYRLMSEVEEQMSREQRHHLSQIKRESRRTKDRRDQLVKETALYGWMGGGGGRMDRTVLITEKRLKDTTLLIETTQRLHKDAVHSLSTVAKPQAEALLDLCQRSPASAVHLEAAQDPTAYVRSRVQQHVADFVARIDSFTKDEITAYVREQLTQRTHRAPLSYSQVDYLRRWREHQLQSYKGDMTRRKRLIRDTSLGWTQELLERESRRYLLTAACDQVQTFQEQLMDPTLFPVEGGDSDAKEEEEALRYIHSSIEASLTIYDESAVLHLWLSQLASALRESSESLWALNQRQWKTDLLTACSAFLALQGLKYDQNLSAFRALEVREKEEVAQLNREGLDQAWNAQMRPYVECIQEIVALIEEAINTHRQQALECARQCVETYIIPGTTGDIPSEWFFQALVDTPEIQTLIQRAQEGLKKKKKKGKDAELIDLQQRVLSHVLSLKDSTSLHYTDVDSFFIVLHFASLSLSL